MVLKSLTKRLHKQAESKKTSHLCDHFGPRPTLNRFDLGFINFNSQWSNNIIKKLSLVGAKRALPMVQ